MHLVTKGFVRTSTEGVFTNCDLDTAQYKVPPRPLQGVQFGTYDLCHLNRDRSQRQLEKVVREGAKCVPQFSYAYCYILTYPGPLKS